MPGDGIQETGQLPPLVQTHACLTAQGPYRAKQLVKWIALAPVRSVLPHLWRWMKSCASSAHEGTARPGMSVCMDSNMLWSV